MEQREKVTYLLYVDSNGQQYMEYLCASGNIDEIVQTYAGGIAEVFKITKAYRENICRKSIYKR